MQRTLFKRIKTTLGHQHINMKLSPLSIKDFINSIFQVLKFLVAKLFSDIYNSNCPVQYVTLGISLDLPPAMILLLLSLFRFMRFGQFCIQGMNLVLWLRMVCLVELFIYFLEWGVTTLFLFSLKIYT